MATRDFDIKLNQELNIWAAKVFEKVKKNFTNYNINKVANKKDGYTGDLYRKMWWTVHNAAGGNKALVKFFYMKYGDFVQWGVGRKFGDPRWPSGQKLWDVPSVKNKKKEAIPNTQGFNYASKPFLRREIRYQMKGLVKHLAVQYAYFGEYYIIRGISEGFGDKSVTTKWIQENKMELSNALLNIMGMER